MLSDDEILGILQAGRTAARGEGDKIDEDRERALDYVHADPDDGYMAKDLPPDPGQSKAVSTDVSDAIETVLPDLMEIFAGGDNVVAFAPFGPEDEKQAEQETDYVSHVFYHENPGWMVLYENFKDALTSKTGVFKWWWEDSEEWREQVFENKTNDEWKLHKARIAKGDFELADEDEPEPDPETELRTYRVRRKDVRGRARVATIAPEDFFVDPGAVSLADAAFAGNISRPMIGDLLDQKFDADQVALLNIGPNRDDVRNNRDDGQSVPANNVNEANRSAERVEIVEYHAWLDMSGEGDLECWKIITGNQEAVILDKERIDGIQYSVNCPFPETHKFYGRSLADMLVEVQKIKTALMRMMLNAYYFSVNPRPEVVESGIGKYTMSDLLANKPGRPIRVKNGETIKWKVPPIVGDQVLPVLEYMSVVGEGRSGVVRNAQGLNPDTLHDTAKGAMELMSMAQRRVRMIARIFAETGVKDLFLGLHDLIVKHGRQEETVRLRGEWVPVDPNKWSRRKDLSVEVGLGSNTKAYELQFWTSVLEIQREALQAGLADPQKIYNSLKKFMQAGNVRSPEMYFNNPAEEKEGDEKQETPPDPEMQKAQAELQLKAQEQQQKMQLAQQEAESKAQLEVQKFQFESQLALYKMQLEMGLAEKAQETETRLAEFRAQSDAQTKTMAAAAKANTDDKISNVRFGGKVG